MFENKTNDDAENYLEVRELQDWPEFVSKLLLLLKVLLKMLFFRINMLFRNKEDNKLFKIFISFPSRWSEIPSLVA